MKLYVLFILACSLGDYCDNIVTNKFNKYMTEESCMSTGMRMTQAVNDQKILKVECIPVEVAVD